MTLANIALRYLRMEILFTRSSCLLFQKIDYFTTSRPARLSFVQLPEEMFKEGLQPTDHE